MWSQLDLFSILYAGCSCSAYSNNFQNFGPSVRKYHYSWILNFITKMLGNNSHCPIPPSTLKSQMMNPSNISIFPSIWTAWSLKVWNPDILKADNSQTNSIDNAQAFKLSRVQAFKEWEFANFHTFKHLTWIWRYSNTSNMQSSKHVSFGVVNTFHKFTVCRLVFLFWSLKFLNIWNV